MEGAFCDRKCCDILRFLSELSEEKHNAQLVKQQIKLYEGDIQRIEASMETRSLSVWAEWSVASDIWELENKIEVEERKLTRHLHKQKNKKLRMEGMLSRAIMLQRVWLSWNGFL